MEEYLEKQLERVDKWLSFAEAKNAALIAFNVAILQAVNFGQLHKIVGTIYILGILLSTGAALLSFMPFAKFPNGVLEKIERFIKKRSRKKKIEHKANLIFWGDIACFPDAKAYLNDVKEKYFDQTATSDISNDFAVEIWENSGIASRKYKWFKIALYIDLSLVVMLGFLAVIA